MMVVLEIAFGICAALALIWGMYASWKKVYSMYLTKKNITPIQAKNKSKEMKFLENMLDDVRKNTDDWFLVEDVTSGFSMLLANDKKNIGIVYNGHESMTILLNLENLTEFDRLRDDTVKLSVAGDHVKTFLITAEEIIDRRGREIQFFQDELEKRL